MTMNHTTLKLAAIGLLDALAAEHPIGHQQSKAKRYLVSAPSGFPLELMFEGDARSPPNVWIDERAAGSLAGTTIKQRRSPRSKLRTEIGKDGSIVYGRHSGLEKMPQLGEADLVCFAPASLSELGAILDQVLATSAKGSV